MQDEPDFSNITKIWVDSVLKAAPNCENGPTPAAAVYLLGHLHRNWDVWHNEHEAALREARIKLKPLLAVLHRLPHSVNARATLALLHIQC